MFIISPFNGEISRMMIDDSEFYNNSESAIQITTIDQNSDNTDITVAWF